MDEYILDDNEQSTETVVPGMESVETDKSNSENTVVNDSDRVSDSSSSDDVSDVTNAGVETSEESEDAQAGEEQTETSVYFNEDLGAYPVYLVEDNSDDVMALANYSDYYTYLPNYNIPSNNRELQQQRQAQRNLQHYNIPSNNRELQPVCGSCIFLAIITYQVITGNYSMRQREK